MAPPCHMFLASELPDKVQEDVRGRRRKLDAGNRRIDLPACELLEMLQYKCEVKRPLTRDSPVQCFAVERLFRKCQDKKGTFMVETTAWEGADQQNRSSSTPSPNKDSSKPARPLQWSSGWLEDDSTP